MPSSNEWREWHLTPRGWERGDLKLDNSELEKKPLPSDRVLTCIYSEEMLSPVSARITKRMDEMWRSEDEQAVETLLKQHGSCPRSLH